MEIIIVLFLIFVGGSFFVWSLERKYEWKMYSVHKCGHKVPYFNVGGFCQGCGEEETYDEWNNKLMRKPTPFSWEEKEYKRGSKFE